MIRTLAFDIYGTLINTHAVATQLAGLLNDEELTKRFTQQWRDKQLEYSFRRGLMGAYADFSVCTRQALDFCCDLFNTPFSQAERNALLATYAVLPAYAEVNESLNHISQLDIRLIAFSNGSASAVDGLLNNAGLSHFFEAIVSVEELPSFKPDPRVYDHLLARMNCNSETTMLVSSNPFDVIGASHAGWKTAWIDRGTAPFDPWDMEPDMICGGLHELAQRIK